jgi:hypothetical protein
MIAQIELEKDMKLFEEFSSRISSLDFAVYACGKNDGVDLAELKKLIPKVIESLPKYIRAEVRS